MSSEVEFGQTKHWWFLGALGVLLVGVVAYVAWPRVDGKAALDRQITEKWMEGREVVDALEFFEKGGVYENRDSEEAADIDQQYVVPMLKRVAEEHHLKVLAILEPSPPNTAMAILVEVPPNDRQLRNKVRATILEEADKFPGFAMMNWSHNYVSLDFFDEVEMTPLIQANALEPLKASQSVME